MSKLSEVVAALAAVEEVAILSHIRPDGDAVGSTLALGLALQSLGKRVHLWNEHGLPARYAFLEGAQMLHCTPEAWPAGAQALVCVDTGAAKRLGEAGQAHLARAPLTLNIDHHETNECYADVNVVEGEAAACGCVIYRLLLEMGVAISRPIAEALYAAVSTDTGSFQYASVTADVLRMAAALVEAGVDVGDINRRLYQDVPMSELLVRREVLNRMVVAADGAVVYYSMPAGMKAELGVNLEDTKDLVDIIRVLKGTKVAVIFEDLENGYIRMSLRSKDPRINVAELAARFGGGGHAAAAGIRMRAGLEECRERVLQAIYAAVRELS